MASITEELRLLRKEREALEEEKKVQEEILAERERIKELRGIGLKNKLKKVSAGIKKVSETVEKATDNGDHKPKGIMGLGDRMNDYPGSVWSSDEKKKGGLM